MLREQGDRTCAFLPYILDCRRDRTSGISLLTLKEAEKRQNMDTLRNNLNRRPEHSVSECSFIFLTGEEKQNIRFRPCDLDRTWDRTCHGREIFRTEAETEHRREYSRFLDFRRAETYSSNYSILTETERKNIKPFCSILDKRDKIQKSH